MMRNPFGEFVRAILNAQKIGSTTLAVDREWLDGGKGKLQVVDQVAHIPHSHR